MRLAESADGAFAGPPASTGFYRASHHLVVSRGATLPGMSAFDAVDLLALLARDLSEQHKLAGRTVRVVALRATG